MNTKSNTNLKFWIIATIVVISISCGRNEDVLYSLNRFNGKPETVVCYYYHIDSVFDTISNKHYQHEQLVWTDKYSFKNGYEKLGINNNNETILFEYLSPVNKKVEKERLWINSYNYSDKSENKFIISLDDERNPCVVEYYNGSENSPYYTDSIFQNNEIIVEYIGFKNGDFASKTQYFFSKDGLLDSSLVIDADGIIKEKSLIFNVRIDDENNWISRNREEFYYTDSTVKKVSFRDLRFFKY